MRRLIAAHRHPPSAAAAITTVAPGAAEVGLDADEVRRVLNSDAFATEVRADENEARRLGIRGVPFFVFDGRNAVSGAHPADTLLAALTTAWTTAQARVDEFPEGASCGPHGCA